MFFIFQILKIFIQLITNFFDADSYFMENEFYALYICSVFGPAGRSCCKTCLRDQNLFSAFWKHMEHLLPTSEIIQLNLFTDLAGSF